MGKNVWSLVLPVSANILRGCKICWNLSYRIRDVCCSIKSIEIYSLARNIAIECQSYREQPPAPVLVQITNPADLTSAHTETNTTFI